MEFLIDITLKSTLILLFSGLILLGLKKASATLRHWIISLTMMGLLLLPLLVALIPDMEITVPYLPPSEVVAQIETPVTVPVHINEPVEIVETIASITEQNVNFTPIELTKSADSQADIFLESEHSRSEAKPISLSQFLPLIWLFGFGFFLLKLCLGLHGIRRITINSSPFTLSTELQKYTASCTKKKVQFLINSTIKTPMTWGGFRPVILLPAAASAWSTTELKTVLIHELNHIKRNDYWIHTLGLLAVCFYWFNPLIWLMKRQQLLEREKACDEAVLRAGIRQQNYAEQLVSIARNLSGNRSMISENALPMAKMSQTKARVLAILNFDDDRFQFSAWKQRNWGLLYVLLFPILAAFSPVGKELLPTSFDLPKLENITQLLETSGHRSETITTNFLDRRSIPLENENRIQEDKEDELAPIQTKELLVVESLTNTNIGLAIAPIDTEIKVPEKQLKTGLFRKWGEGKSVFKVWTYGTFKSIPEAPYLEVTSDDGIIFIEEYIFGIFKGKSNQLTIAKAPYDCRERPTYKKALDMRPEALIKEGMPIKIWSENRDYDKWISSTGKRIAQHLMDNKSNYLIKEVADENSEWWNKIEGIKEWIDFYFISVSDSTAKIERRNKREALKQGSIPYKKLNYSSKNGELEIIGNTTLSGNNVGNMNTSPKGTKYITVLDGGNMPALVKSFNFHLSENDFNNLEFDLQLYNMEEGEIKYAITKSPIPITVEKGSGWVKVDLSKYGIVSKGKVLVVLENKDFSGTKNRKKLYFSLTDSHQDYEHLISANYEWKTKRILERDFVMYLDVEQASNANDTETGYLIKFQNGKSNYRIWTYGDFKTHQTAPYIEVLSPDGLVVIEEIRKTTFGTKKYKIAITKAPHEGILVQTFIDDKPNSWGGEYKHNEPLHLWYENDEWIFLQEGKDEWIVDRLSTIFGEIGPLTSGNSDYQQTTQENKEWWSVIQEQQAIKAKRFIMTPESLPEKIAKENFSLIDIPFKEIKPSQLKGRTKKIGRTKATKTMSGFNGDTAVGYRFGTVITAATKSGELKDLNFNIRKHKFKSLAFDCYFFKLDDNKIQHALNEKPVRIEIDKKTGWTSHNLAAHRIGIEGDVLVVLEVADYTADEVSLFFSLAPSHIMYKPEDKFYNGEKLEFWDGAFAMYMTVKQ